MRHMVSGHEQIQVHIRILQSSMRQADHREQYAVLYPMSAHKGILLPPSMIQQHLLMEHNVLRFCTGVK